MRSIVFLLLPFLLAAEPKEVRIQPHKLAEIKIEGKEILWRVPPGVDYRAYEGGRLIVATAPAGRYTLLAATLDETGKLTLIDFVLVVEGFEPLPPPRPDDPLKADLAKLFAADPATDKAANMVQLAAVYRQAAALAKAPKVQTAWHLSEAVREAKAALLPGDVLADVRKRCSEEVAKAFKDLDPDAELTAETRKLASETYGRIGLILEGLSK